MQLLQLQRVQRHAVTSPFCHSPLHLRKRTGMAGMFLLQLGLLYAVKLEYSDGRLRVKQYVGNCSSSGVETLHVSRLWWKADARSISILDCFMEINKKC